MMDFNSAMKQHCNYDEILRGWKFKCIDLIQNRNPTLLDM